MGEAFKRMRAAAFRHRQSIDYQNLIAHDLRTIARKMAKAPLEISVSLKDESHVPAVGDTCIVGRVESSSFELIYGNQSIASLSAEAEELIEGCSAATLNLHDLFQFEVTEVSPFGGLTLRMCLAEEVA